MRKIRYKAPNVGHFPLLEEKVNHGFSWGKGAGNMKYEFGDPKQVEKNIQKFLDTLEMGPVADTITIKPEHSDRIVDLTKSKLRSLTPDPQGMEISCDTIFTRIPMLTLAIKPADCLSTLVYATDDEGIPITGFIHTGIRGAEIFLAKNAIKHLTQKYGCRPEDIYLGISPHAHEKSLKYINTDKIEDLSVWDGFHKKRGRFHHLDHGGFVVQQYLEGGIPEKNMQIYNVDTVTAAQNNESFSHHYARWMEYNGKKAREGRFMIAARLGLS